MAQLAKAMDLMVAGGGTLPQPDANLVTLTASGTMIGYQGCAGSNTLRILDVGGKFQDPLDGKFYTYSTNANGTRYQIAGLLENSDNPSLAFISDIGVPTAFAGAYDARIPLSKGMNLGILVGTGANLNQPVQELGTASVDIVNTTSTYGLVFTGKDAVSGTGTALFSNISTRNPDVATSKNMAAFDSSLVGYWDMETLSGTLLKDMSGKGNNGTCYNSGSIVSCGTGGSGPQFTNGAFNTTGRAMNFDGVDDWIDVGTGSSLNVTGNQMTVFVIVSPIVEGTGSYDIIGRHSGQSDAQGTMVITSNRLTSYQSTLSATGAAVWNGIGITNHNLPVTGKYVFAFTYDGSKGTVSDLTNGKQESVNFTGNLVSRTGRTLIGKYVSLTNAMLEMYKGSIDEVRIYNRALTPGELQGLYTSFTK